MIQTRFNDMLMKKAKFNNALIAEMCNINIQKHQKIYNNKSI